MSLNAKPQVWNPWPIGIIAFFVIVIGLTIGFVWFSLHQPSELVTANYYEEELQYEEELKRLARTKAGNLDVSVRYDSDSDAMVLVLPELHRPAQPKGSIRLYRPSAAEMDREHALAFGGDGTQVIDASELSEGLWRIRVEWAIGAAEYVSERELIIDRR